MVHAFKAAETAGLEPEISLQHEPYASYWFPSKPGTHRSILDWAPGKDPEAPFNRSRVPLHRREQNKELKAHPNARAGEGRITSCAVFHPTSDHPAQGLPIYTHYAFGYWQYIDSLVFWGGAVGEGIILAPTPQVTDAAHRNGVKVYGTVFFADSGCPRQWLETFVEKDENSGRYPVIDQLIRVTRHYGFDGWFINEETGATRSDEKIRKGFWDCLAYAQKESPIDFVWYDAQGSLTESTSDILQRDGERVSDAYFLDYAWCGHTVCASPNEGTLPDSAKAAGKLGRSPYDLYAGLEMAQGKCCPAGAFPEKKRHTTSVGLFNPEMRSMKDLQREKWTKRKPPMDLEGFHRDEAALWVGERGDPSDIPDSAANQQTGLARYIAESTPVCALPFVTNFNAGHGRAYYTQGKPMPLDPRPGSDGTGWCNLSLQDVLPTYRWITSPKGHLAPSLDFTDAYEGGTCLRLDSARPTDEIVVVRLYQTRVKVTKKTAVSIVVKTPTAGHTHLRPVVAFDDAPDTFVELAPLGATSGDGWERKTVSLAAHADRTLVQLGLGTRTTETASPAPGPHTVRIGQIALYDTPLRTPSADNGTHSAIEAHSDLARVTLRWTSPEPASAVHHFEVHRLDGHLPSFVGATLNEIYYAEVQRREREQATRLQVVAVAPHGARSGPLAIADITWR
jgi:endo-beta-N-acetylglucosaminidase D